MAENIAHRLARELETQVGPGAHDPVIAPPGIFLRHPHHQPLGFLVNSGTTPGGFAKLRSVELVGDELSVLGQQRIRFRDSRQMFQGFPSGPVNDFGQRSLLGIG
jgi:hypothetical protein